MVIKLQNWGAPASSDSSDEWGRYTISVGSIPVSKDWDARAIFFWRSISKHSQFCQVPGFLLLKNLSRFRSSRHFC